IRLARYFIDMAQKVSLVHVNGNPQLRSLTAADDDWLSSLNAAEVWCPSAAHQCADVGHQRAWITLRSNFHNHGSKTTIDHIGESGSRASNNDGRVRKQLDLLGDRKRFGMYDLESSGVEGRLNVHLGQESPVIIAAP